MAPAATQDRLAGLTREQRALLFEQIRRRKERAAAPERIPRRPADLDLPPLSFAQERLWFIDRLEPGLASYNMPLSLRISGGLSPALLAAILGEIVRRHESLRTTFHEAAGEPVQVIAAAALWHQPFVDLTALPAAVRTAEARRLAQKEAEQPFDLRRGPLLRAVLLRLDAGEHALLLDMHHIISDGWSLGVLAREITALYGAAVSGTPSPLPELPIQYADFAVWQRRRLQGEVLERQIAFWRQRLAGVPTSLDLPTDRPRPAVPSSRGGRLFHLLGPGLARGLAQLARRHEASPYMVLLAGFQALLGRLAGQQDLAVGSPIANRHRAEIEPLIGFFVNTLVMRGDLSGDPTFNGLLGRVRQAALEAYAHQDLPFERLVEELRPERHLSVNPLFQVVCAMQNAPIGTMDLPGLSFSALDFDVENALFDLELNVWEQEDDGLLAIFTHSADLFDPTTVRRIAGYLEALLRDAVADPERPLSALALLARAERHQLLREWNDAGEPQPGVSAVERFEEWARRTPEAPAVIVGGEAVSYGELNRRANRLAWRLRRLGVGPGVVVGLSAERTPALVAGLLGIWKAGGAYVPLDPALPPARREFMVQDSGVEIVVTEEDPDVTAENDADPQPLGAPDDLAYLIYTSGTTGQPKAVAVECRHVESTLAATRRLFAFGPADRMPCVAPFSFDIFLFELLSPLLAGGVSQLLPLRPTLDVEALVDALAEATLLHAVPALMRQVVDTVRRRPDRPRRLRALFAGGDVVPAELVADLRRTFPGAAVWILYGPTEAAILATAHRVPVEGPARPLLGRPLDGVTLDLRDAGERPVPPGGTGEIWIGGAGVTRGYLDRPELTAEKFVVRAGRRFFRSGDLARRLPDGSLEFLGRLDDQVKVRGFRIELGEVESALARHPRVGEAVVAVRSGQDGQDRRLVAWVVPRETGEEGAAPAAADHVAQWRTLYDETYGLGAGGDAGFNLQGWNSSYTGEPIPAEEMREWVDVTVARLLALPHRRVLEVGCGTGLLLFRVAPEAERYAGTDFSAVVLDLVRREAARRGLAQVELVRRTADDWSGVAPGSFDLVILNSVVQYFPGVDYLLRVLAGAVRAVRPGGAVWIGDVRSLPLLPALHESVERFRSGDSLSEDELRRRVRRRVAEEEELVLDPDLFHALADVLPVQRVEVLPKGGRYENELTRFRYDVVLHVGDGARHAAPSAPWRSFANDPLRTRLARTLVPELRRALQAELPDYMVPAAFLLLDSLPLTAHGKVDRAALSDPEPLHAAGVTPPGTPAEIALAGIWQELLGLESVGLEDNFFELGGHSLLATQLVSRLRSVLEVEVPLRSVFENPTLGALAAACEAQRPAVEEGIRREPAAEAPLSFSQERLWFLDRLQPGASVYNIPSPMRLRGPLRPAVLARCFAEILRRHEALRTRFAERQGVPVQVIDPPPAVALPWIDLTALPPVARQREAERITAEEAVLPFDLQRGPVLRFALLGLGMVEGEEEHVLLLTLHHAVSDGWSVGVLTRELTRLYEAFALGSPSPLPDLPVQYADFARWQREWLAGPRIADQLAYWRERLAGHPPSLDLPRDRPRPAVQTFRGGAARLELPRDLSARLNALAVAEKASAFMVLLAAFEVLLQRLSGRDDLLVGIPVAGRTRPEVEDLIGFFLNTLVLRTDLAGRPAFRELVQRVRAAALGAYSHQEVPFEKVLEAVQPERDLSRTPLFEVFFNMLNLPPSRAALPGGLAVEPLAFGELEAKFDLTVYAAEGDEGFVFNFVYNADLFDRARIEEMLRQYRSLLAQAAGEPDRAIDAFVLLTPEAAALLPDPTAPLGEAGPGLVHELFAGQARRRPRKIALADIDGPWTYGELHEAVRRLAGWLRAHGVQPGDRVAIHAHRSAPLVWAVFAVLEAGAAFVILDPAYPAARLAEIVDLAGPRAFLHIAEAGEIGPELEERLADIPARLDLPGGGPEAALAMLAEASEMEIRLGPDDLALVAFTSGSTGVPKGILGRHGPLSHFLPWMNERFGLSEDDRHTMLSGLSHDPLQRDVFGALCTGATLCIPPPEDFGVPGRLAAWMAREAVTVSNLTPAMAQMLTEPGGEAPEIPALRWAFLIGDALTRRDVERLHSAAPRVTCVNLYGATETQRALSYHVVERGAALPAVVPLGRGMPDCQLLVLDRGDRLAGIGEVGEIAIRSPHLARGYLGDEALTRERFVTNPFTGLAGDRMYRTGDLGRYLLDGEVAFAGRADRQVKIRGFRIELGEIEAALRSHPQVRQAVAVLLGDAPDDRRLAAWFVGEAEPDELRARLRGTLPDYMVPATFTRLEALPLTPNGKLDLEALPDPGRPGAAFVAPRDPLEEELAAIWSRLLKAGRVGVHDNFFELGGHSLLATRVLAALREAFGVEIPLRSLFERPTVAELAPAVAAARGGAGAPAERIPRLPRDTGRFPVSASQLREWLLDRLLPGTGAYNIPGAARVVGPLDPRLLQLALDEIVRRHESLRTTFAEGEREPVQVVAPALSLAVPLADLSALPAEAREEELRRLARGQTAEAFDLARGPLLRVRLLRLAESEHLVLFTIHHIVSDGWSMSVFFRELATLYLAFSQGFPSPLPELPVQYADYAVWQRRRLEGEGLRGQLDYWRGQLAGVPPLELATDRPRPPVQRFEGARQPFSLAPDLSARLHDFARCRGASLFMTLLAGFTALLARWSGQEDFAVGTFAGNRNRAELEGLIGFFINSLVLRLRPAGEASFHGFLEQARDVTLGAFANQDVPFERLLEELRVERDFSRTPLFQVMLVLQNFPDAAVEVSGVRLEPLAMTDDHSDFDLSLWLTEGPGGLDGYFSYGVHVFDRATIVRLGAGFEVLLRGAVDDPELPLRDLPLLTGDERRQLLAWSAGPPAPPAAQTVEAMFAERARLSPEAPAVEWDGGRLTYAELDQRSGALAARLRALGVGPEVLVGLAVPRSPEMVVALLAVLKAGGAYLPLDPAYPEARREFMIEDAGVAVMLSSKDPRDTKDTQDLSVVSLSSLVSFRSFSLTQPAHPAYVIYTSGSTGQPKGVVVEHRSLAAYTAGAIEAFSLTPADRVLQFASISFDTSGEEIYPALASGATLVLRPEDMAQSIAHFLREVERLRVTVLDLPTAFWHELVAGLGTEGELPDCVRLVILGGEKALPEDVALWHQRVAASVRLLNTYGPTEATIVCTRRDLTEEAGAAPIGRPIPGARVHVLDRWGAPVPVGVPGELHVGGAGLARGYLRRPEITAERFVPDPFGPAGSRLYRTGDLTRWLASGELEFLGRVDQQVKLRGFRVELGEIEAALRSHPAVRDAAVVLRPGPGGDPRLVAYTVRSPSPAPLERGPGGEVSKGMPPPPPPDFRTFLRERLPDFMVPAAFMELPALPLTPSGKVDRRALPEPEAARPELAAAYEAPRTELERTIAGVWRELLGVERIGLHDNFFDLGAHSLLLVRAHSRLREALGRELTVVDLFRHSSVGALARHLSEGEEKPTFQEVKTLAQQQKTALGRQRQAMERLRKKTPKE